MKVIDFHSHILPRVDHGSLNLSMSLSQIERIGNAGVDAVVATPHFYPYGDTLEAFVARREKGIAELSAALDDDAPKIYVGAEVLVCPGLQKFDGLDKLCVSGTDVLLLEMPTNSWMEELINTVSDISDMGYRVVLAHIDRYKKAYADRMVGEGYKVQLNADAFGSIFARRRLNSYISRGCVVAVGSDIHRDDSYAPFTKLITGHRFDIQTVMEKTEILLDGAKPINR